MPVAITVREIKIVPMLRFPTTVVLEPAIRPDFRRAVTMGLYRSIVMPVLIAPLIRLKGRNIGISMAATASRGYPM